MTLNISPTPPYPVELVQDLVDENPFAEISRVPQVLSLRPVNQKGDVTTILAKSGQKIRIQGSESSFLWFGVSELTKKTEKN